MKIFLILPILYFSLFGFTLEEVEQRAKKENSDILIQKNELSSTSFELRAKKAKRYGQVDLFSSYTKYDSPRTLKPLAPPISSSVVTSENIANYGASYTVVLFNGFKDAKDVDIANIQESLQKNMLNLTYNQVIYNVRALYIDILSLRNQKKAQDEYLKSLFKLKENITQEVNIGKKAKVELLKVEADLQNVLSGINNIQANINILKSSLNVLINHEGDFEVKDIEYKATNTLTLLNISEYFEKIENLSYFKISKLNEQKSISAYKKSKAAYYPRISANTQYSEIYSTHGDDDKIFQFGLSLNWNAFDFGMTNALVEKAKIEKIKSSLELKKRELEVKQKIIQAINQIKQSEQNYKSAKKEFLFTEETNKIEKIRYEQEAIDIYNYLYAKGQNEIVKAKEILAKYSLLKAHYYFEYILEETK
ncbi:TolC family protein [Poseidonibacter ostreae]|jgi:outer membrane protein|uniref:TolC family protein n=1 Tax=Poseidonibacter ostreae TaxID=2654171 RepID=A0A6L4WVX2_9BACT|nr:TolC family protein [Poseidonibacter ostreae]KAB7886522.1 hypothetical protein GA417_05125 [Poseidonibacter ostreae]KAB7890629.1 hypothetical protein GBG19_02515 [Poseidonibacter ostreae]KAB7892387.1 hypothetical protein GBG18_02860 [Poseidonibacter ostreae]MAD42267.1 hypothetical protein [Arcobacter sp.]|tara:strand:+ start:3286 stop:4551 length:1266 start_codon:yes stop_codon:yes gene_type:complete